MSSVVCGVESPQPKSVVEDSGDSREAASRDWKEEDTYNFPTGTIQKDEATSGTPSEAFEKEEDTKILSAKGEDDSLESHTKENHTVPSEPLEPTTEEKCEFSERKASTSASLPLEKNKNVESKFENSGGLVEKNVGWFGHTAEIASQLSYPVGTVSLTSYPPGSLLGHENAKRMTHATQPSFFGIPTWITSQTGNSTHSDIHPELLALHSYHLSNDSHTIDEEARSASLVLLKLKNVTGDDGLELPTIKRKKWKRESVSYSQNNEDHTWRPRTLKEFDSVDAVETDASYRAWKRSKSHESGVIPPQTEVACRVKEEDSDEWTWVLGIVDSYSNSSGQYRIIDIEELGNEEVAKERYYFVSPSNVIPLSSDTKHVFPAETRVLAIYPDTTVFYPATIRSSRKNGKQLYYALEFDDEDEDEEIVKHVPARYQYQPSSGYHVTLVWRVFCLGFVQSCLDHHKLNQFYLSLYSMTWLIQKHSFGHMDVPEDSCVSTEDNFASNCWQTEASQIAKQGTESAKRARKIAEEARSIGIFTAEELGKQTEQLETVQDDVEAIHSNLGDAEYIIHEIEDGFLGEFLPFRKPVKSYKRTATRVESRTIEETKKGISGLDIDGMKTGKTDKNSTRAVVKNQERRKKEEEEKEEGESIFKNPLKYLWTWWNRTDSNIAGDEISSVQSSERRTQLEERPQQFTIDKKHSQTCLTENTSHESLAPSVDKHIRKQDEELDKIGLALKDMKEIALRMNEELSYQEQIIDNLQVNMEDADYRLHSDLRRVKRI
ncbi:hypothetical protein Gasu2_21680 [Galdieria sulphuraria]|nr:hypothetical protein Gasu2_21680 [Galdieria sulphuraria]